MNTKNIIHFFIGPIGAAALGLITIPFVAWFFSAEDVGRLTMFQVVLGLSLSVISLQMHQAYVREYNEVSDKKALLRVAFISGCVMFGFFCVVAWLLPFSLSSLLFGINSSFITAVLFICIFSFFLINLLSHVVRMQERGLAFSASQILPKFSFIVLIVIILFFNLEATFQLLIFVNAFALLSSLAIFLWLTRDSLFSFDEDFFDKEIFIKMVGFGFPLIAGSLAYWALTALDRFFLRAYSGFEELALYSVAASFAASVSVLSSVFSNIWHPVIYRWIKIGFESSDLVRVIEYMSIFIALVWSLVGLLSFSLAYVLPPDYLEVKYLILACVAMPLFYMWSETTVVGIGISRKTSFSMLASIVALFINVILNVVLIPEYGAAGAAVASALAFFVLFFVRTESSCYLWQPFPRFKVYFVAVIYLAATVFSVLRDGGGEYFYIVWFFLFFATLAIFYSRALEALLNARIFLKARF